MNLSASHDFKNLHMTFERPRIWTKIKFIQPKTHCSQLAYFTSKKLKNKNAPNSQKNINKH